MYSKKCYKCDGKGFIKKKYVHGVGVRNEVENLIVKCPDCGGAGWMLILVSPTETPYVVML